MQTDNPLFEDLARLAGGLAGGPAAITREIDQLVKARLTRMLAELSVVPREEVEVMKEQLAELRAEQRKLHDHITELEKQLGQSAKSSSKT